MVPPSRFSYAERKRRMRKQLMAIITKLEAMQARADELANSENETTADRYCDVPDAISAAIDSLQEAVDALESDQ